MASIPTTTIYGPKGTLTINTCDLETWKAKGYSTTPQAKPAKAARATSFEPAETKTK